MAIKIAVANKKGGIGKTSTSLALTECLSRKKYKCLLIDSDSQMNSTSVYTARVDGVNTLADMVYAGVNAKEAIQHLPLGDIIPADSVLEGAESSIPSDADRFYKLKDSCEGLDELYDFIIIDCPPGNGVILGNVLSYSDYVIIPIVCDKFSIKGLNDFDRIMSSYKKRINPSLSVLGVLITKYKSTEILTRNLENNILPEMAQSLGGVLFESRIRESVKLRESQILDKGLLEYDKDGNASRDYEKFTDEVIRILQEKGKLRR